MKMRRRLLWVAVLLQSAPAVVEPEGAPAEGILLLQSAPDEEYTGRVLWGWYVAPSVAVVSEGD